MEHRRARDETPRTRERGHRRRPLVDAAIHLERDVEALTFGLFHRVTKLLHDVRDERLAPKTRMHGHDQQQVDQVKMGRDRLVGCLGVQDEPNADAKAPHLGTQGLGLPDLHMHRAGVRAGVTERLEVLPGVGHHQVAVEEHPRAPPDGGDDRRPDGDVGNEVAVHHVEVKPVGHAGNLGDLGPQCAEVG